MPPPTTGPARTLRPTPPPENGNPSVSETRGAHARSPIALVLRRSAHVVAAIVVFSCFINLLMLTGSVFMMQVYDRVMVSRSVATLIALALIAAVLFAVQGLLEVVRSRLFLRIAERVDGEIGPIVFRDVVAAPLRAGRGQGDPTQSLRDMEAVRSFLSSHGMAALFDLPWIPIYLVFVFALDSMLGWLAVGGAVLLLAVTVVMERWTAEPSRTANRAMAMRSHLAETAQRGTEVVTAMGMMPAVFARWAKVHDEFLRVQRTAGDVGSGFSALSRTLRLLMQSAVLAVAAYLAITEQISSGSIIAASVLSARALAPIDQTIAGWRHFVAARQAYRRLLDLFEKTPPAVPKMQLPTPSASLRLETVFVGPPGAAEPIIRGISFALAAGDGLGIIGPSASGKSTLGRTLVGLWEPLKGRVMLDRAPLAQWDREQLGRHVGYLPQDVQLFDGTVAENIARLAVDADSSAVIEAARCAGLHEHILALPDGYNTRVGLGGAHLSAGQRQRLGLARALYGNPFLVVLDEPNANLDADGEISVTQAIRSVRDRGGIAVVIAHRPSAIAAVDQLLVMRGGEIAAFGPKEDVLAKTVRNAAVAGGVGGRR